MLVIPLINSKIHKPTHAYGMTNKKVRAKRERPTHRVITPTNKFVGDPDPRWMGGTQGMGSRSFKPLPMGYMSLHATDIPQDLGT